MPWTIERRNNQYCVIKADGSTAACHKTRSRALRHQRALYANEPSAATEKAGGPANFAARAGETIRGNLARAANGRFTSGGGGGAKPKPKPKPARRSGGRRGGGGKPKKSEEQKRAEQEAKRLAREEEKKRQEEEEKKKRQENQDNVAEQTGLGKNLSDALLEFASPEENIQLAPHIAADLEKRGLVERGLNGEYRMTSNARAYISAAQSGDVRRATDVLSSGSDRVAQRQQRSQERDARRQERERKRQEREARRKKEAGASSFAVFKDASGRWRWVAFSSNGYRDRDGEIVSTKALEDDCLRADTDGDYGPLRWWHMQGLDIGDCDFNAMHGRVLIESGTFREDWIAERVKTAAPNLEISIGFMHPIEDPDREKVFNKIRRFERSLTPRGKASNTFTRFFVQEATKMVKEKLEALKTLLGVNDDRAAAIIAQAEMTEKAAQDAGIAFKAEADEEVAVEEMAIDDVPIEVEAEVAEPMDMGGDYVGDMTPDEFKGLLAEAFTAALEPLVGALNFETKMRGMMDELKGTMGGYVAKKDAEGAEQAERIAALEAELKATKEKEQALEAGLKELAGDVPRGVREGYRASQDPATVIGEDHRLKGIQPTGPNYLELLGLAQQ